MRKLISLILIILIPSCQLIKDSYHVFIDAGSHAKYEINVSKFRYQNIALDNDSIQFMKYCYSEVYDELLNQRIKRSGNVYNPKTKQKIATSKDTIIDIRINNKLSDSLQGKSIYFIPYLIAIKIQQNDSVKSKIFDPTLVSKAILVNNVSNKIQIIKTNDTPYGYNKLYLMPNIEPYEFSTISNIQHVLVDYKYYGNRTKYLSEKPKGRKVNPEFWKNVEN